MKFSKPEKRDLRLNMTSMLDIVFQLIIFFILVTNFAAADLPPLEPPDPDHSVARRHKEDVVVRTINIVPETRKLGVDSRGRVQEEATGRAEHVLFDDKQYAISPDGLRALTQRLGDLKTSDRQDRQVQIDLRVDRRLAYRQVAPVMRAVTSAGIARINIVALLDTDKNRK
jgi:biopolymer transport protein ExbD